MMQLTILLLVATSTLSQASGFKYQLKMAKSREGPWKNVVVKIDRGKQLFTLRTPNATEDKTYTFTKDTETEVKDGYVSIKQLETQFRSGWVPTCIGRNFCKKRNLYFKSVDKKERSKKHYETFKTQILKLSSGPKFTVRIGMRVLLDVKGVKDSSYNGLTGTVLRKQTAYFNKTEYKGRQPEDRWMVRLDRRDLFGAYEVSFKEGNLVPLKKSDEQDEKAGEQDEKSEDASKVRRKKFRGKRRNKRSKRRNKTRTKQLIPPKPHTCWYKTEIEKYGSYQCDQGFFKVSSHTRKELWKATKAAWENEKIRFLVTDPKVFTLRGPEDARSSHTLLTLIQKLLRLSMAEAAQYNVQVEDIWPSIGGIAMVNFGLEHGSYWKPTWRTGCYLPKRTKEWNCPAIRFLQRCVGLDDFHEETFRLCREIIKNGRYYLRRRSKLSRNDTIFLEEVTIENIKTKLQEWKQNVDELDSAKIEHPCKFDANKVERYQNGADPLDGEIVGDGKPDDCELTEYKKNAIQDLDQPHFLVIEREKTKERKTQCNLIDTVKMLLDVCNGSLGNIHRYSVIMQRAFVNEQWIDTQPKRIPGAHFLMQFTKDHPHEGWGPTFQLYKVCVVSKQATDSQNNDITLKRIGEIVFLLKKIDTSITEGNITYHEQRRGHA